MSSSRSGAVRGGARECAARWAWVRQRPALACGRRREGGGWRGRRGAMGRGGRTVPEQSAEGPNKPLAGRRLLLPIARFRAVMLLINYSQIPCARPTAPFSWILRFLALRRNRPLQIFPTQPSRTVWVGPVLRVHRHSSPIIFLSTTRLRCHLPPPPTECAGASRDGAGCAQAGAP